jgi:CelD/BcsL family acetyltransferase involved in cellulose biosynthesis
MPGQLVALAEINDAQLSRWRRLAAAAVEPNPFFEPEFLIPATEALAARDIRVAVVERGDEWDALVPVKQVSRWHRVPVPGTVGWDHRYCFLGTPLAREAGLERTVGELANTVIGRASGLFFGLDTIAADGPVFAAIEQAAAARSIRVTALRRFERATVRRRPDGAYLSIKPKHRREYRRQRDRLGEQLGAPLETTDEAGETTSVEDFLELEASGWKGRAGTAFAQIPGHARFFRSICERFAAAGRLQLLALRSGRTPVAMKCNLLAGEGVFCFKIAFDERWTRFSPGLLLELDNIERFHAEPGLMWMDSCADPDNEMINRLWPDRRALATIALGKGLPGTLSRGTFRVARQARKALKGS